MSWIYCARVIQVLEEHVTESNNGDGRWSLKSRKGKKQRRKFLPKTKRLLKSSTQPTIFNLCFLKLSLSWRREKFKHSQLINCDGGVDAQPLTPLQWNVALQTKDWLQHWKLIKGIHLYTKLMSVYQVELRNPEKYREPTNTVTGRPSDFFTFGSRDDKGVTWW